MKWFSYFAVVILLGLSILSCKREDEPLIAYGSVVFSYNQDTTNLAENLNLTGADRIVVTIKNAAGNIVCENSVIPLKSNGSKLETAALPLPIGSYTITKYMIADSTSTVLDATPYGNAYLGPIVRNALPIKFSIDRNKTLQVSPEVTNVKNYEAQKFGYATFKYKYGSLFSFLFSVDIFDETTQSFLTTTANLEIKTDSATVSQAITAESNLITLKDVPGNYIFTVTKDNFETYTDTISQEELIKFYNKPYVVILDKPNEGKVRFNTIQSVGSRIVLYAKTNNLNNLKINWGDGLMDIIENDKVSHVYSDSGLYRITISGKVDDIYEISAPNCRIKTFNVNAATSLEKIDLSRNQLITKVDMTNLTALKELYCVENSIEELYLQGSDNLEILYVSVNKIQKMDLSAKTKLKTLYCDRNLVTSLDITKCPALTSLLCSYNSITSLDISQNTQLTYIDCKSNKLSDLNIASNPYFTYIDASRNTLTTPVANKLLIDLLASVKVTPRVGKVYLINVTPDGAGAVAQTELKKLGWIVDKADTTVTSK